MTISENQFRKNALIFAKERGKTFDRVNWFRDDELIEIVREAEAIKDLGRLIDAFDYLIFTRSITEGKMPVNYRR